MHCCVVAVPKANIRLLDRSQPEAAVSAESAVAEAARGARRRASVLSWPRLRVRTPLVRTSTIEAHHAPPSHGPRARKQISRDPKPIEKCAAEHSRDGRRSATAAGPPAPAPRLGPAMQQQQQICFFFAGVKQKSSPFDVRPLHRPLLLIDRTGNWMRRRTQSLLSF